MSGSWLLAVGGFIAAFVLLSAIEWAARREDARIPTLGDLCAFVMQYQVGPVPMGRIGVLGFWWWIGWHFFAR